MGIQTNGKHKRAIMCIIGEHTEDRKMTDYSNMSRCEAVERCIGLEREVKRMTDAVARIAELEKEAVAQRWLLDQCNQELECAGVTYVELRCYLKGTMTADDLVNLSTEPSPEANQDRFYLQESSTYLGNDMVWWRQNGCGYTADLRLAHVFTMDESQRQHKCRGSDIPWPKAYIDKHTRTAVNTHYIDRSEALIPRQQEQKP